MKQPPLIFVIYDSIYNTVFQSQVLTPLLQLRKKFPDREMWLVSFEKKIPSVAEQQRIIPVSSNINLHFIKKGFFLGKISLWANVINLRKMLTHIFFNYELIARGPLAGFICLRAFHTKKTVSLTIQARGLLAQEYLYENPLADAHIFVRCWRQLRAFTYAGVERSVYINHRILSMPITIEAVSGSLKQHLVDQFHINPQIISIALDDILPPMQEEKKIYWRAMTRKKLAIDDEALVYCYAGSLHAWQCPDLTIAYFKQEAATKKNAFLLILTNDPQSFQERLHATAISSDRYIVLKVAYQEMAHYLAAADIGLLFRKPHPVNWVSRPTKLLEYRAAGLTIIHNGNIGYLVHPEIDLVSMQTTI